MFYNYSSNKNVEISFAWLVLIEEVVKFRGKVRQESKRMIDCRRAFSFWNVDSVTDLTKMCLQINGLLKT